MQHSRLYTFIDGPREFALYFLEGQRLIRDLALLHRIQGAGFAYFRDAVLSIQPMIALLKHGEQFGFYIDSEEPFFRLKIETAHHGGSRSMLLPEGFSEFPEAVHGLVRVQKLFPNNRPPYESVLEAHGLALGDIVNSVLRDSYQTHSTIIVGHESDQSLMLHQLPPLKSELYDYSPEAVEVRRDRIRGSLTDIFARALARPADVEAAFAAIGFRLLASRTVRFECSCSRPRMIHNIRPLYQEQRESLFDPGRDDLDVTCEYCKSQYQVSRQDLEQAVNPLN